MTYDIGQRVGRKIKLFREAKGLTQAQLAGLMGKSIETISNFERGKTITSLLTLEELGRRLEVGLADFFDPEAVVAEAEALSQNAKTIRNSINLLPEEDLEIVAGLIGVLEARRRKSSD